MKLMRKISILLILLSINFEISKAFSLTKVPKEELFPLYHSIVIFAPHPDDETLFAAGIIQDAVLKHIPLKIVVVTNGDILGQKYGNDREVETIRAMKVLGVPEEDIIFLGYADQQMMTLFNSEKPTQIFKSKAHNTKTYAHRGLNHESYHKSWANEEADYNRENVKQDINLILKTYQPDGIFTTSRLDQHPDHRAVQAFVSEAIRDMAEEDNTFHPTLYEAIVHAPGELFWPYFNSQRIKIPKFLKKDSTVWTQDFFSFNVPSLHEKLAAIRKYKSQLAYTPWLVNYAKIVEPFQAFTIK